MKKPYLLFGYLVLWSLNVWSLSARAETITLAAASDLKFAMDAIITRFKQAHPEHTVHAVYGSSGKMSAQIQQGAPYDVFFSADIQYPRTLAKLGLAASPVTAYAKGRLVLWRLGGGDQPMTLVHLAQPEIKRIAIANPEHAPYGQRAKEALMAAGLWEALAPKLVYGENVAQTAQFVQTGNVQVGLIALSLAVSPELSRQGRYDVISEHLHSPLEQGFIITQWGKNKAAALAFTQFMREPKIQALLIQYGFEAPMSQPPLSEKLP